MQSATSSCPPSVFRERYRLADFEVTKIYNEGANWRVCTARCSWSGEPVVLQTYQEGKHHLCTLVRAAMPEGPVDIHRHHVDHSYLAPSMSGLRPVCSLLHPKGCERSQ